MAVTEDQILETLRAVEDPDFRKDIVSLGFVKNVKICGGDVSFDLELTTPACPVKETFRSQCTELVGALSGVENVKVSLTSSVRGRALGPDQILPEVKNVIAVASGKGGVGKSTVAANLALALSREGAAVGLLDADIYGPSVPTMMGVEGHPDAPQGDKLDPLKAHGVSLMSMGFLLGEDAPLIWRGPLVAKLVQQFLGAVNWGALDYLVIDLPPGTGDAQLTLTQTAPLNGAVIVTTPQDVSLIDARKGLMMFQKVNVPILGIVENMSSFACPHCGKETPIFRQGGGERISGELGVPFLGSIPIDPEVTVAGDEGTPIVARNPSSPGALAFSEVAGRVAARLSVVGSGASPLGPDFHLQWK